MPTNEEKIVLGSGKLYIDEYDGSTIPDDATLETEDNLLGLIQGGATLEYKPSNYTAKDDLGLLSKTILTEEEALLKSGIMTWCGKTLQKLCSTARVTEYMGKRTVKIGGVANQDGKSYVLRFVHKDATDGDIRITIVGSNQAGLALVFAKDKETVIDAEFLALPHDSDGTKIIFTEDIVRILEVLTVISAEGTLSGDTAITVSPELSDGNSYMYDTDTTVTLPELDDVCDVAAGFTAWDGSSDITASEGDEIMIIEVDSNYKALAAGKTTVDAKA